MTYSLDFRKQVLKSKNEDKWSYRKTAKFYSITVKTIQNWEKELIPKTTRNKPPTKIKDEALLQDVADYPDAYHHERAERLNCSKSGISDALKRLGITRKKEFNSP